MADARDPTLADDTDSARLWRRWIRVFVLTTAILGGVLYAGVVLVDPFSTGRFSLSQGVDNATRNPRRVKGGVARVDRFDAAILGSTTG